MQALSVVVDGACSGAESMRRDTELLRRCAAGATSRGLRLYWFAPPCLSLGRMQPESDVDRDACARDGVDVVRRPSGGGAVLHRDEVTYALVCRVDDPQLGGDVMTSCARIHAALAEGIALLGVPTMAHAMAGVDRRMARVARADCFSRPSAHELLDAERRKLAGSAQARHRKALLQHGSVLLAPSAAAHYLHDDAVGATGDNDRLRAATPGLRALAGRDLSRDEVALALAAGFHNFLCAEPLDTTA